MIKCAVLAIKKWERFGKITFILKNSGGVLTCIPQYLCTTKCTHRKLSISPGVPVSYTNHVTHRKVWIVNKQRKTWADLYVNIKSRADS